MRLKRIVIMVAIMSVVQCMPISVAAAKESKKVEMLLEKASQAMEKNDIPAAKVYAQKLMTLSPGNPEVEMLMAEVINREVAMQMEAETSATEHAEHKVMEEFSQQDRKDNIKTWLERSKGLLELGHYDEAVFAAEKVFLYDPENITASQLIDRIKNEAITQNKNDDVVLTKMYHSEVEARIDAYIKQAQNAAENGRWGAAKIALVKILLLDPENEAAGKLYEQVKNKQG